MINISKYKFAENKRLLIFLIFLFSFTSYQSLPQNCNIISKANNITPDGLCAPVTVNWEVIYRGVNDGGTAVEVSFDWDDGNPVQIVTAVNTNPDPLVREWTATASHVYPPGGNQCNYNPSATLRVNGVLCTSTIQEQNVTVWDTDDQNGGYLSITPQVFRICVGNSGNVIFTDNSTWNCEPPNENDVPNTPARWIQWIYGTNYTIANVEVNGVVETYPFRGPINKTTEPIFGPMAPWNTTDNVFSPNTALVGQFFEITLRNWNYCNPYDNPAIPGPPADTINGDFPPEITTAMILIVDTPDATINPAGPFCANDPAVNLTAATGGGTWSGTGITNPATGRFNPSTAGPGTHTITYIVTDGNGCTGRDTVNIVVYLHPQPNILPGPNAEVCPGDTLFLDGNPTKGTGTIISHQWTGNTGPLNSTTIQSPYFVTSTQGTYSLTYTVTDDNGCSESDNITISVNPVTASIIPDPAEVCVSANLNLNGNPSGGTGNYVTHQWTGDTAYLNNPNIQTPLFNHDSVGVYNLTYTVIDDNGCWGSDNIIVTVFPNPVSDAGLDDSICGPTYSLNAIPSIGIGTWTKLSGAGIANFVNANSATTNVSVTVYGSYRFVWTEVFGPGCADKDTVTIVFVEIPVSDAGPDGNICALSYTLSATASVGIGIWTKLSGPGTESFVSVNSPNTNVTVSAYGQYQFIWEENNRFGCIDSDTVLIRFDLVPTPAFSPIDTSGCHPFIVTFNNTSYGGSSFLWDFGDGTPLDTNINPIHTFYNPTTTDTTFQIKLVVSNPACPDSITHNLVVHPLPKSAFSSDAVPGCSPVKVNFFNNSSGAVTYIWDYGDGTSNDTITNPSHTFTNDTSFIQFYDVNLIAVSVDGCMDTSSQFVTVYPLPDYDFTVTPDSSCHPANVQLSSQPGAYSYFWNYGDSTSETKGANTSHIYTNTTNQDTIYTITLITTTFFGCIDTAVQQVVVYPNPTADFILNSSTGCTPFDIIITNSSIAAIRFYWNFGDGNTDTTTNLNPLTHTYINSVGIPVNYNLKLIVETDNGCTDTISQSITVYPDVLSSFTSDSVGCTPLGLKFSNQSYGATFYSWNFGDSGISTSKNPTHVFINNSLSDTIYPVRLIVTSAYSCTDTSFANITVYPTPDALFHLVNDIGCSPFATIIVDSSAGATDYLWNFGDGVTSTSSTSPINHTYINSISAPNNYNIKLIVENSYKCKDSLTQSVTVYPEVIAGFISDTAGCSPLSVKFTNQSYGALYYSWNFGDGDSSIWDNPSHTYINNSVNDTTYHVRLIAESQYGCTDTAFSDITVYPSPVAGFTALPATQVFPNATVTITNLTSNGTFSYLWDFDDANTSVLKDPLSHSYNTWGDYTIQLIVHNSHCYDTAWNMVRIIAPPPIAGYDTMPKEGCVPLTVHFTNNSQYADSYLWDFGDGGTSTQKDPEYTYNNAGDFPVTLIVTGPGGQDVVQNIIVHVFEKPSALFKVVPALVTLPDEPIRCYNFSSDNVITFLWDFGDNTTSAEKNPTHLYTDTGMFDVSLSVWTEHGCFDSLMIRRAVTAIKEGRIKFPNGFTPNPNGSSGGQYDPNDLYNNTIFFPIWRGVTKYRLLIYNRWGELIFESTDVKIGWDGYYRGELCKQDVYVWKASGEFSDGEPFVMTGDVTLLR